MNKRMKKKTSTYKALTYKERVKNQQVTLHQLFIKVAELKKGNAELIKANNLLGEYLKAKEETIKQREHSLSIMSIESAKKIHRLEELVEFHRKDVIATNAAYQEQIDETERIYHKYEVERDRANDLLMDKNQADELTRYWQTRAENYQNLYHECINKPWWKKVLNIG